MIMEQPEDRNDRPVPYVVGFSPTGVMTIAWDRPMKPVENPEVIPPTRVAVNFDVFMSEEVKAKHRKLER